MDMATKPRFHHDDRHERIEPERLDLFSAANNISLQTFIWNMTKYVLQDQKDSAKLCEGLAVYVVLTFS